MAPSPAERSGPARLVAAARSLGREQRLVAIAAAVLLGSMLLPWYSRSVDAVVGGKLVATSSSKLAITVFSFVEAAIFLVAAGVLALMLARGDRRAFHLPGGDGLIVAVGGAWATFLIFFRFVDKPGGGGGGQLKVEYGLSWGIFFGLLSALGLLVAGLRLRAAHISEPALPGDVAPSDGPVGAPDPTRAARHREREERRRAAPEPPAAASEPPVRARATPDVPPTTHAPADQAPTTVQPFGEPPAFEPPEFHPPPRRRDPR